MPTNEPINGIDNPSAGSPPPGELSHTEPTGGATFEAMVAQAEKALQREQALPPGRPGVIRKIINRAALDDGDLVDPEVRRWCALHLWVLGIAVTEIAKALKCHRVTVEEDLRLIQEEHRALYRMSTPEIICQRLASYRSLVQQALMDYHEASLPEDRARAMSVVARLERQTDAIMFLTGMMPRVPVKVRLESDAEGLLHGWTREERQILERVLKTLATSPPVDGQAAVVGPPAAMEPPALPDLTDAETGTA